MKKNYFEIGFIGGAINSAVGTVHKIASQMDGKFKLVAGCFSKDHSINKLTGEQWGIIPDRVYDTWEMLLKHEKNNLDAVVMLTPTPDHGYMIGKALNTDFAVISEKSLTKSVDEAINLKKIVNTNNCFLTITYNYTGYPVVRELKHIIKHGELGKINQILVEMPQEGFIKVDSNNNPITPQSWRLKDYEIPTISLDLGIHVYNLINFIVDEDAVEVIATENSFGFFKDIVDDIHAIARFSNDLICNIWYSKSAIGYRNGLRIRVFGSKGSAEWYQMNPEELILSYNNGDKKIITRGNNNASIINQLQYNRFKAGHPSGFIEAFANLYNDIFEALSNYKFKTKTNFLTDYTFGIDDALKGLIFLESLHKSFIEKKWIKINKI